ncbi:hypothetical protein SLS62_001817 [Diatrype stigma]|uniref:Enoyl reductase (ER) domain-containing protein n=1 Tax=Diatrype stigma TaxID=117547 RepID=A0AAN9V7Y4_9PEZI
MTATTTTRTHSALMIVGPRQPYEIHQVPTVSPQADEVLVRVLWTSSTPLDLHRADGGLLVDPPFIGGSSCAGVVVEAGAAVDRLRPGDRVFGFGRQEPKEMPHQEFVTGGAWSFGKIPDGISFEEAVTLPTNFVTVFHTMWADLNLPTPWPKPADYVPPRADDAILVWGAASSVGQYALQVLRFYGYRNVSATASPAHHALLRDLGARAVYDYRSPTVVEDILAAAHPLKSDDDEGDRDAKPAIPLIVDCIGSVSGTLRHLVRIARPGSVVAVMLPVILKHATRDEAPEYSMEVATAVDWAEGVVPRGVRTHFFWKNDFFVEKLESEIMPELLARGVVKPNKYRVVEGRDLKERATRALDLLRDGVSAEKLVWRVAEE